MAMATKALTHLYDTYEHAAETVRDLEAAGIPSNSISMVANKQTGLGFGDGEPIASESGSNAGAGATLGATIGGGAGLLAGLGIIAIPGIGPVVAAGWLAATALGLAAGTVTGGIVGSLTHVGVSEQHAHVYAEGVRRGGTLVTVRDESGQSPIIQEIMLRHNPVDPDERGNAYREDGWSKFDETTVPVVRPASNVTEPTYRN
jgi:hypothetical protein